MISETTARQVAARLGSADWTLKSEIMSAAVAAQDDDHFWQLLGVATPDTVKVGPKGYIHGWIFVGAPGVGARVFHPQHGHGTVTGHDGKHATVKFDGGKTHSFEAREGEGGGKLTERAKVPHVDQEEKKVPQAHPADRAIRSQTAISSMSDSELKDADDELARRAAALGRPGQVSKTHQKVKDELAQRGAGTHDYEELADKATRYDATEPSKEGSVLRTYSDPDKQREAIRLHTAARRLAPDARAKRFHTAAIDRHKGYLKQISNNQSMKQFEQDKKETEAELKELKSGYRLAGADGQNEAARLEDKLADIHEQRAKDLDSSGYGGSNIHHVAAERHRGRADSHRDQAAGEQARQDAAHAAIREQMSGAEAKVADREALARKTGKQADIDHAVAGHEEISRHARAAGMDDVADRHDAMAQKLKDDVASGAIKPAKKPAKSKVPGLTAEGAKEPQVDSPWGKMHPADLALQHPGGVMDVEHMRQARTELERRGVTEGGRDKISRTHAQLGKDIAQHERARAEYNKPGGRGEYDRKVKEAEQLSETADRENTSAAHTAAARAHSAAVSLAYRHGGSLSPQSHNASARYHEAKAARLKAEEGPTEEEKRERYKTLASIAPHKSVATSGLRTADQFDRDADQHRRAAELAPTDKLRAKHLDAAQAFENSAKTKRAEQAAKDEADAKAKDAREKYQAARDAADTATSAARGKRNAVVHEKAAELHRAAAGLATEDYQRTHHTGTAEAHDKAVATLKAEKADSA